MRVLVTGGAGFIGSNFVRRALRGKYYAISEVIVVDALTYAGNLENIKEFIGQPHLRFIEGNINDHKLVQSLTDEIDVVINFAAESHVDRSISNPAKFLETNIHGVFEILESIKNSNVRLLQVSTDEVYGSIESGSWNEDSPLLPNSPYSASKASAELLCRSYFQTYKTDVVITRCSNNYGTHHHPEKFIPRAITNVLQGKPIPIYGNGRNIRDWIHVDDHCDGIYSAIMKGRTGEVYNFGGNNEISNLSLAKIILSTMKEDENKLEFIEDRLGHDLRYSVDINKSKNELDFNPKINFNKGLEQIIDWYTRSEEWWRPLI